MSILRELQEYAEGVGSSERTLALVAARWIAAEPAAASDPLLRDLFERMRAPKVRVKSSILDYFSSAPVPQSAPPSTRPRIYCDGACQANGRRGARAGFGGVVFVGQREIDTVSEPLPCEEPQTNQRAELRALQWAFGKAMSLPEGADIYTDSEYAMKCFTEWGAQWATRGWRKATGGEVLHQDILRPMWEVWKSRGGKLKLHHVSAHTGGRDIHSVGNARADALAVASLDA